MANPMKGEAGVTLSDGRELKFAFDVNAWIDIEGQLGMKMPEIMKALADKKNPPDLTFQRALFWGGLQKHHPEMTLRDAGAVMIEAAEPMAQALSGGMPVGEDGDKEAGAVAEPDPPKPTRGTGTKD